jgi:hypothetical protein
MVDPILLAAQRSSTNTSSSSRRNRTAPLPLRRCPTRPKTADPQLYNYSYSTAPSSRAQAAPVEQVRLGPTRGAQPPSAARVDAVQPVEHEHFPEARGAHERAVLPVRPSCRGSRWCGAAAGPWRTSPTPPCFSYAVTQQQHTEQQHGQHAAHHRAPQHSNRKKKRKKTKNGRLTLSRDAIPRSLKGAATTIHCACWRGGRAVAASCKTCCRELLLSPSLKLLPLFFSSLSLSLNRKITQVCS